MELIHRREFIRFTAVSTAILATLGCSPTSAPLAVDTTQAQKALDLAVTAYNRHALASVKPIDFPTVFAERPSTLLADLRSIKSFHGILLSEDLDIEFLKKAHTEDRQRWSELQKIDYLEVPNQPYTAESLQLWLTEKLPEVLAKYGVAIASSVDVLSSAETGKPGKPIGAISSIGFLVIDKVLRTEKTTVRGHEFTRSIFLIPELDFKIPDTLSQNGHMFLVHPFDVSLRAERIGAVDEAFRDVQQFNNDISTALNYLTKIKDLDMRERVALRLSLHFAVNNSAQIFLDDSLYINYLANGHEDVHIMEQRRGISRDRFKMPAVHSVVEFEAHHERVMELNETSAIIHQLCSSEFNGAGLAGITSLYIHGKYGSGKAAKQTMNVHHRNAAVKIYESLVNEIMKAPEHYEVLITPASAQMPSVRHQIILQLPSLMNKQDFATELEDKLVKLLVP